MTQTYSNVIVFGPTGGVGRAVALEASRRGAHVWLAMRDPSKQIPGLSQEAEEGKFQRTRADLTDAASIKNAIQESKAEAAFFYLTHAVPGMADAVNAMKEGGIKYLVFLSSFTTKPDTPLESVPREDAISWLHVQVELTLLKSGIPHTNLRPGSFASNVWRDVEDETNPRLIHLTPDTRREDCIVPHDIGVVGGAVLVKRPSDELSHNIYLIGPDMQTREEQAAIIDKVYGVKMERKHESYDEHTELIKSKGVPEFLAKYLVHVYKTWSHNDAYPESLLKPGQENIKKYTGYEPTNFEEYVKTTTSPGGVPASWKRS